MNSTREHLLGYLLGALDRAEQDEVESELDRDPTLREELRRLEACVGRLGLDAAPHEYEPPAGLASRTCRFVSAHIQTTVVSRAADDYAPRSFGWSDLVVAAAVVLVAASLFFPAVAHSRLQAQVAGCANQLRYVTLAMHEFSDLDPDRAFPLPAAEGNRGVAGVVPVELAHRRLVPGPNVFLCPSAADRWEDEPYYLPTSEELDAATDAVLAALHRTMGGDYGYNMGYVEGGRLQKIRNSRRPHYPLVTDAPSAGIPGRQSANHGGRGQNVGFEDGSVRFIRHVPDPPRLPDDPFHNLAGEVAAGEALHDAVIGCSSDRPMPQIVPVGLRP